MAWNTITYACGHGEEKQLYGKIADRDRTVAAALHHDCPACRSAKAQSTAAEAGLPTLVGTEKQIAWASEVRGQVLQQVPAFAERLAALQAKVDAQSATRRRQGKGSRAKYKARRALQVASRQAEGQ